MIPSYVMMLLMDLLMMLLMIELIWHCHNYYILVMLNYC
jgi:hypothetical protein